MAMITRSRSNLDQRRAVALGCLIAGVLFGLLSVYSDTRASCAIWVVVALALVFASGLLFGLRRQTSRPTELPPG